MPTGIPSYEERIQAASKALGINPESLKSTLETLGMPKDPEEALRALDGGAFSRQDLEALIGQPNPDGDPSQGYSGEEDGIIVVAAKIPFLKLRLASAALLPEKKQAPGPVWVEHNAGVNRQPIEQWDDHSLLWEFIGEEEEGKQEALSRELVRRSKGGRFLVVNGDGSVDVEQSLAFLKVARKGHPPVPPVIMKEGRPCKVVGVEYYQEMGEVSYISPLCGLPLVGGYCPETGLRLDHIMGNALGLRLASFIELERLQDTTHEFMHWARGVLASWEREVLADPALTLEKFASFYSDPNSLNYLDLERNGMQPKMVVPTLPVLQAKKKDPFSAGGSHRLLLDSEQTSFGFGVGFRHGRPVQGRN